MSYWNVTKSRISIWWFKGNLHDLYILCHLHLMFLWPCGIWLFQCYQGISYLLQWNYEFKSRYLGTLTHRAMYSHFRKSSPSTVIFASRVIIHTWPRCRNVHCIQFISLNFAKIKTLAAIGSGIRCTAQCT